MPLLGPLWVYRDSVGLSSKGAAAGLAPLNLPLGPILWLLGPVQGWLLPVRLENCSCDSHVLCMCVCVIVDLCTEQGYDSIRAGSVQQVLWKKWFWLLTSLFHYCLKVFISIIDCWYATNQDRFICCYILLRELLSHNSCVIYLYCFRHADFSFLSMLLCHIRPIIDRSVHQSTLC